MVRLALCFIWMRSLFQNFGADMDNALSVVLCVALETILGTSSYRRICDLRAGRFTVFRKV